ncbi:hypothetical protein MUN89_12885 [Halobacillus salinarum]|uniref:Sulfotransferase family protein n=1 Tax=Halobacillus salinarum TaxID=2932257 RepID=A0ABY4EFB7_9BACI|nr:sulfotransferase family protein [Halobacillus salinarum]UOQ42856.1 hypothetical protein MUN89_12885 [Halobacillus salinarum]
MDLKIVGAGLPRTGTSSLKKTLEELLGAPCCHMSALPGHPFNLANGWKEALKTGSTNWDKLLEEYIAAVDWPVSLFWKQLSEHYPDAVVLLSVRENVEDWWESVDSTILKHARKAMSPDWQEGRDLVAMLEQFTGTKDWDHPEVMKNAYLKHNQEVRNAIPSDRLVEWKAADGWEPICHALNLPVPDKPFPWLNKRNEWS